MFGLVAAIAAVGASLVFAANLDRLVTTPGQYGWRWDAILDTYDTGASAQLITAVRRDDDLSAVTVGTRGTATINGRVIPAFGLDRLRGDARPIVTEGRWPRTDDEIALGAQTLRDLDRSVGDTVSGRDADGRTVPLRIAAKTLLPSLNLAGSYRLGDGAAMSSTTLGRLDPNAKPSFFLVDLHPGMHIADLERRYNGASTQGPQQPGDIQSYARVRATPLLLAGLLALLGCAVLAHLLITSVRDRQRDLAILKALGFSRRQVSATIAWQATTLIGIALLLGIPLGVLAGRWTWITFADGLGVASTIVAPIGAFIGIAFAAVVLGNLIASFPARTTAHTRVGVVLSSE